MPLHESEICPLGNPAISPSPTLYQHLWRPGLTPDAVARAKDVAAFEPTLDSFTEVVARAGGDIKIDVIKAKPRAAKQEAH